MPNSASAENTLERYHFAIRDFETKFNNLRTLMSDNLPQQRLDRLYPLVIETIDELNDLINARQSLNIVEASSLLQDNPDQYLMDDIRQIILNMIAEESRLLDIRYDEVFMAEDSTFRLFVGGTALTLFITGVVFYLLNAEIASRKKLEIALRQSQEFIEHVIEVSPAIVYVYDLLDGHIRYTNQAAAVLLGTDHFPVDRVHPDDQPVVNAARQALQHAAEGEVIESETRFKNPMGEWRWLCSRDVVFSRTVDGKPSEVVGTVLDITERKLFEQQEIERGNILRTFVENASHDLNTPITVLTTSLALLERYCDMLDRQTRLLTNEPAALEIASIAEKSREKVQSMDRATTLLRTRVSDMLDMVRLEHDLELQKYPTEFNRLLENVIASCRADADQKGVSLIFSRSPDAVTIAVDEEKLTRALCNVVFNAINYNHQAGTVNIRLAVQDEHLQLEVEDSGIGITESDLPHIFERFYRADKARSIHTGGTGLGLSMTKQIIEAHGGSITVTSQVNLGTTVRIILPQSV